MKSKLSFNSVHFVVVEGLKMFVVTRVCAEELFITKLCLPSI